MIWAKTLLLTVAIAIAPTEALALSAPQDATVRIIATTGVTHQSIGSGFFVSASGRVVTCYHVIMGARELVVLDGKDWYKDVTVDSIAPEYDLAVLSVNGLRRPVPFVSTYQANPTELWKSPMEAYGLPSVLGIRGDSKSYVAVRSLSESFIHSGSIRSQGEIPKQLFAREIDLIGIDMTIYNRDSGGPLVYNGRAVGVISGSIEEGGSIAWGIPIKYYLNSKNLSPVGRAAAAVRDWPPLALMKGDTTTLRKEIRLGATLVAALDRYGEVSHDFLECAQKCFDEMRPRIVATMKEFEKVVSHEISLKGANFPVDRDPAIEDAGNKMAKQMELIAKPTLTQFDQLGERLGDASEDLANELANYLKALPKTKKNQAIEGAVVVRWELNRKDKGKIADRGDDALDAWEDRMGKMLDNVRTLGETQSALSKIETSINDLYSEMRTSILKTMEPNFRQDQVIIESLFDSEPDLNSTRK